MFLIAVIALIGIVVQLRGDELGRAHADPDRHGHQGRRVTSVTKKYVVKSGDSLSSIAVRFNTTTSELQALNPDIGNTLVVGTRIVVPRQ